MNIKAIVLATVCATLCPTNVAAQNRHNLVPEAPSAAPDYFCTWNVQGYVVSYSGGDPTREVMNEAHMFGQGKYRNWVNTCYPTIRKDLYFVMDDSWDIPQDVNTNSNPYLGTAELDSTRFPSFQGNAVEKLSSLVARVKAAGWKGAGGWICAQKPGNRASVNEVEYWTEKLKIHNAAGFSYWKVDWGSHDHDGQWRKALTALGRKYAPKLWIEHALGNEFIEFSDTYRTYDVENITAQPVTIQRVCDLLPFSAASGAKGIINCEDEPYIAAALGCAIGVMRHPFGGNLPDGSQDITFPPVGRDVKRRLDEVVRGVRWHRIALPFGVDGKNYAIDSRRLEDSWTLQKDETWNETRPIGSEVKASAPARVSRGMPLVEVSDSTSANRPFILASRYPSGATAVASIGRALGRSYVSKAIDVAFDVDNPEAPIGLFGRFASVTVNLPEGTRANNYEIYAQDLAANKAENITEKVNAKGNSITLPGDIIEYVGLAAATPSDLSDPGLVVRFFKKHK